ncbi:MAG: MOSC domain-containing protein [Candidatus Binatia bacterium]
MIESKQVTLPTVSRLFLYPIKSLDRLAVSEARLLSGGALAHDREFALFDHQGNLVNGKRQPRVHLIHTAYDLANFTVTLRMRNQPEAKTFHLLDDRLQLEAWFSEFFGFSVTMKRDTTTGFPDDPEAPGPTLISAATLDEVSSWFSEVNREQASRRFRANIEITNVPAFWEDRLFGESGEPVKFTIGQAQFHGINPCQRCVVPTRHPDSGDIIHGFQKTFSEQRKATLPPWATVSRFNHFYRLSINTRVPVSETGKILCVGDELNIGRTT